MIARWLMRETRERMACQPWRQRNFAEVGRSEEALNDYSAKWSDH